MSVIDIRRSKKERFFHGENLRDYEAMHRAMENSLEEERKKRTEYMRRKPYGVRKEGA